MKVAIVGAGVAGLAAARELKVQGVPAVVFEKSRGVGGRIATRRLEQFTFDTGAQSIAPYETELTQAMLHELPTEDLVTIQKPVYLHEHLRVSPGDPKRSATPRYTYRDGNTRLAKLLAQGLDVRTQHQIDALVKDGEKYLLEGETFDAVILTMPVPQASLLLWALNIQKPTAQVRYRPCTSVLLGFNHPTPATGYHALLNADGSHPLQWLSLEHIKCPDRAPEGSSAFVAQLSESFTLTSWDWPAERLVAAVCGYLTTLFGTPWQDPTVSDIKHWKYSQPQQIVEFDVANAPGDRIVLAGDGLGGGRIEYAFKSGLSAARSLLQ